MKARRVKGLDPATPLADNAERIVRTRLDELCGFMPAASDPDAVTELRERLLALAAAAADDAAQERA